MEALGKVEKSIEFNFSGYVLEIYSQLGGHWKAQINHLDIKNTAKAWGERQL